MGVGFPSGSVIGTHIHTRMNRWSKAGVLDRVFEELQRHQIVLIKIEAVSLDSTIIKIHLVAANDRTAITFAPIARTGS